MIKAALAALVVLAVLRRWNHGSPELTVADLRKPLSKQARRHIEAKFRELNDSAVD